MHKTKISRNMKYTIDMAHTHKIYLTRIPYHMGHNDNFDLGILFHTTRDTKMIYN